MDAWLTGWLTDRSSGAVDPQHVRVQPYGRLPLRGPVAIWHPLDDLYTASQLAFTAPPHVDVVTVGGELAGYVLRGSGEPTAWDLGDDASTDTDRFFLVHRDHFAPVIDWMNEDVAAFEQLGGTHDVETVEHESGARVVVLRSPDGNARIRRGIDADGQLAVAIIDC